MLDLSDLTFEKETPVLVVENFNAEMGQNLSHTKDGISITLYKPSKEICSKMESKYGTKTKLLNRTIKIPNK